MFDWKHAAILVVALLVGFYIGKRYPSVFASVPGLNMV